MSMEALPADPENSLDDISSKTSVFENVCSSCNAPSKYRCPKCLALSCSLNCVKAHKLEKECDGIRDKTAFVPLEDFKDRHLHSDYHFLEDIGRKIDNAQRKKEAHGSLNYLPQKLFRLQGAAKHRETSLLFLPLIFGKRKVSTTYLRYSDRKIFWRVEWSFPQCDFTCHDERIDEETTLRKCLDKYLSPESTESFDGKLMYYRSFWHREVSVLLKDENSPANKTKYFVLNQKKSLRRNFRQKKIIEFPTLLVVPNIHLSCYLE